MKQNIFVFGGKSLNKLSNQNQPTKYKIYSSLIYHSNFRHLISSRSFGMVTNTYFSNAVI